MWKIISINNETHAIKLSHPSGDVLSFTVPPESTNTHADKLAYIQSQCDAQDSGRNADKVKKKAKSIALYSTIVLETIYIVLHLIKVI